MAKISFEEWKNSMSFMIDDNFDNSFLQTITPITRLINSSCRNFSDPNELSSFLTTDSGDISSLIKLKAFVSVIGLSEERLKRVVSLMRFRFFGEEFRTEWAVKRISRTLNENEEFRNLLIDFFINGRNSRIGREMPLYYMRNFNLLNADFITDLSEFNYVERILNDNEIQGKYSNEVGAHVERIIQNRLDEYQQTSNNELRYEIQKEFPLLNKNIDFLIPNVDAPIILIESSYNITTGSGQSKRADQLVELYGILMRHNANHRANRIIMLNYCDGFGWVGRQNDLHRIYDSSDFVFNQNQLHVLDEVLNEYY
ncbi:DpnII family type II restriction endonuclease [Algibacter sp. 2305UL17-15]|uniref:DpnII family type II restriction endonuclease n=1 Tax=Algibacter sp. 2305UL17-15 TaxID=3231268 RepID=UPI00345B376D